MDTKWQGIQKYLSDVRTIALVRKPVRCDRGTIQVMSDIWESCPGCFGCRGTTWIPYTRSSDGTVSIPAHSVENTALSAAFAIGVFVWRAANIEAHTALDKSLAGFRVLADFGRIVSSLGRIPAGVSGFLALIVEEYNTLSKGRWIKVTGKRGKAAKENFGTEGEIIWIGESAPHCIYQSNSGRHFAAYAQTTTKIGIKPLGHTGKPIYLTVGQVTRIPTPDAARGRTVTPTARVDFKAEKGQTVHVTFGKDAGKSGVVFWIGSTKTGKARYGIDTNPLRPTTKKGFRGYRCPEELTAWVDAADVSDKPLEKYGEGHIEVEAACHFLGKLLALSGVLEAF